MLPELSCLKITPVWARSQFFFRGPTGPLPLPPYVRHLRPATPLSVREAEKVNEVGRDFLCDSRCNLDDCIKYEDKSRRRVDK